MASGEMLFENQLIFQFYTAVFFDNGCTIHQHFVVEFHIFQLLLAQSLLNSLKLLSSLKTAGELKYEWLNFATVKEF